MSTTKACGLTEDEVKILIQHHGNTLFNVNDETIERIKYLNGRLKAFKEVEFKDIEKTAKQEGWIKNG